MGRYSKVSSCHDSLCHSIIMCLLDNFIVCSFSSKLSHSEIAFTYFQVAWFHLIDVTVGHERKNSFQEFASIFRKTFE